MYTFFYDCILVLTRNNWKQEKLGVKQQSYWAISSYDIFVMIFHVKHKFRLWGVKNA